MECLTGHVLKSWWPAWGVTGNWWNFQEVGPGKRKVGWGHAPEGVLGSQPPPPLCSLSNSWPYEMHTSFTHLHHDVPKNIATGAKTMALPDHKKLIKTTSKTKKWPILAAINTVSLTASSPFSNHHSLHPA